jgi:hypothetical protein
MTTTMDVTLDNFTEATGTRFRVSKLQAARIALTNLNNEGRQALVGLTIDQAADALDARNAKGKPFNWVEEALELIKRGWQDDMSLTREGALQEFIEDGGLERLKDRRPDIPDSVYLDPDLTVANFPEKVKAAIGVARRFRVSREQHVRVKDGSLTRDEALAEIVAAKRAASESEE